MVMHGELDGMYKNEWWSVSRHYSGTRLGKTTKSCNKYKGGPDQEFRSVHLLN
jgi:hypothetical protein